MMPSTPLAALTVALASAFLPLEGHRDRLARTVDLPSGQTHYEDRGAGPAVVLIHGVSGPMAVWDHNVDALVAAGHRVIRYDLYGRGWSDRLPDTAYDLELYLRQLEELVAALGLDRVSLVGSSFGAVVASEFALHHPGSVDALVLVGPAGFPIEMPALARLGDVPLLGDAAAKLLGERIIKRQNRKYAITEDRLAALWPYFDAQLAVEGTVDAMLATMRNAPVTSYLDSYAQLAGTGIPLGVIWGKQDVTFPYANHEALLKAVPHARLVPIDDAAHLPQWEQAAQVNAVLPEMLAKRSTTAAGESPRLRLEAPVRESLAAESAAATPAIAAAHDFFDRFPTTGRAVDLAPGLTRTYQFPTQYADVTTSAAIFLCDYDEAAKLLPPPLTPFRAGINSALVAVSSYHYGQVRGMPPYNEVAVSLIVGSSLDAPHAFVLSMPVTTLENRIRGRTIWGLPKDVAPIELRQVGQDFVTAVRNADGSPQLVLRVPMTGEAEPKEQSFTLHSVLDGHALTSVSTASGAFIEHTDPIAFLGRAGDRGAAALSLGHGEGADLLRRLRVHRLPLRTAFARGVTSVFDLPAVN